MSDQQTWVEALNINPELLSEWSSQAPEQTPILVFCIEQGLVDYGEYMRFAQSRYELPILQANFFQSEFDLKQLESDKTSGDWQPWFFPVGRWENVTYIACVEPPQEPESAEVRYVLADPRAMREAFSGPGEVSANRENEPPPVPGSAEAELPNGFAVAPAPFVLDLDALTFNIGPETQIKPMPKHEAPEVVIEDDILDDMPDFSQVTAIATPPPKAVVPPPPAPKVAAAAPAPPVKAAAPTPPPAPVQKVELKVVPAPVVAPAPAASTPTFTTPTVNFPAPPPLAVTPNANPARPEPLGPIEANEIKNLFLGLRARYSAALIMKFDGQNAHLFQWDSVLSPTSDTSKTTVNLSYPTFMRIVSKTTLPYHGYLVDSPAHNEFFTNLGLGKLPVCVTAVPVRFDNFIWGLVVAFGSEENQKMDSLNFALEMTEKLMNTMGAAWSKTS